MHRSNFKLTHVEVSNIFSCVLFWATNSELNLFFIRQKGGPKKHQNFFLGNTKKFLFIFNGQRHKKKVKLCNLIYLTIFPWNEFYFWIDISKHAGSQGWFKCARRRDLSWPHLDTLFIPLGTTHTLW